METRQLSNIRFDAQGRALVPKPLRDAMGITNGDEVIAWIEDGRLVLESRDALLARVQARYEDVEGSLSEELIAERQEEAARER